MFAQAEEINENTISAALSAPLMVLGLIFLLCLAYGVYLWRKGTPPDLPPESRFDQARYYDNKDG